MPAYGVGQPRTVYPGQNALAIGFPKLYGGPSGTSVDQLEPVTQGYKSIPICVAPVAGGHGYTQRQVSWQVTYGSEPNSVTWILQGSINDVDDEYQQVDTSSTVGIFTQTVATNFRFFRVYCSALSGPCTAAVKITGQ